MVQRRSASAPQPSSTVLAEELLSCIAVIRRRSRYIAREESLDPHLTTAQIELLRLVDSHPGLTVATAAAELHLAANTVSTLVGQLSRLELLDRSYDGSDRRVVHLDLTEESRRRMSGWRRRRLNAVTKAVNSLDPEERDNLAAAITALEHLGEGLKT
jgi:DNA-binding MarR family transcriptional regulator